MKRGMGIMAVLIGLAVTVNAQMVNIIQITDMKGMVGYAVMNREEFNALLKEIKDETAAYTVAAAESKKEWDANKENKLPFQGNRVKPRTAKKIPQDFSDREKAENRKSKLEERASEKLMDEMEKEAKKQKLAKPKPEDIAKEEARLRAFEDAHAMIAKKMGEKLGRPVPGFGFAAAAEPKEEKKGGH